LGIGGFVIDYVVIETLSKSEGDIVFSIRNDNTLSPFDVVLLSSMVYSDKAESQSDMSYITYLEKGDRKEIAIKSRVDVVVNLTHHCVPKNTITSIKFLSAIAMCAPYFDDGGVDKSVSALGSFCLEGNNIIAVDGR
jgi:hypothetical protein